MERLVLDLFVSDTISTLQYWRDISECDCSSPLPQGGCLRCDLDKILLLGAERRSEPEVAHPLPPVAILCRTAKITDARVQCIDLFDYSPTNTKL